MHGLELIHVLCIQFDGLDIAILLSAKRSV
jgi:hypothetical protein